MYLVIVRLAAAALLAPAAASPTLSVPARDEAVLIATARHLATSFCAFGPCLVTVDNKPPSKRVAAALEETTALRASLSDVDRKAGHVVTVALGRPRFVSAARAHIATSVTVNGVAFEACTLPVAKEAGEWRVREKEGQCLGI